MRIRSVFWERGGRGTPPSRRVCEYSRSNGTLRMECSQCSKGQSLEEGACMNGVISALTKEGGIERIVLRGDWEVTYSRDCMGVLTEIVEAVRFCEGQSPFLPYEECSACISNPRTIYSQLSNSMNDIWDRVNSFGQIRSRDFGPACERCIATTKVNLDHLKAKMSALEHRVTLSAFHIIPGESND